MVFTHSLSHSHTQSHRGGKSKVWLYKLTIYIPSARCIVQPCKSDIKQCLITLLCKVLFPQMMESHPSSSFLPPPPLYCISQASPITVSIPRQATNGGPPFSFADYGSWAPRRLSCCQSEHATSACNSPLQHLASPDQYKSPGVYPPLLHSMIDLIHAVYSSPCHSLNQERKREGGQMRRESEGFVHPCSFLHVELW